ncbi:hypothetical protein [Achromobacter phage ehaak_LB5]|nr:hypothetical protein [Achromobacter phage ehaak_LB5]
MANIITPFSTYVSLHAHLVLLHLTSSSRL